MTPLVNLIGLLIAAGGPTTLMERSPWPLHEALVALAANRETRALVANDIDFDLRPDADVGLEVAGVGAAIHDLIGEGVLRVTGSGLNARLELDVDKHRAYRKQLMSLDLASATALQSIAHVWRARACTAEKTWARALASRAAMSRRGTPNRRQPAATF